jgi:hypothetical protein
MRRFTALLGCLLLAAGCSATPGAPADASDRGAATGPVPTPVMPQPSPDPATPTDEQPSIPVTIVEDDPFVAAGLRIIELSGGPCLREMEVEPELDRDEMQRLAANLAGDEGMLAGDTAFVGSLGSAAAAFGGQEILRRADGGRAVVIGTALAVKDVRDGAPIGITLVPLELADGRTAWLRTGEYVAPIPCEEEEY